jgi:hypothetical protein
MSASTRVYEKMSRQLYKRVGRKYVPANDVCAYDGLREGWWLVKVAPGSTSIRQCVFPHNAEIQAAAQDKEEELIDIIRAASQAKPKQGVALSEAAHAAWKELISKHGDEFSTMHYPSFHENAEKIIETLLK